MKRERWLAWSAFGVWILVCFALQGLLGRGTAARWFPELGLVFLFAILARMEERDAWIAAGVAALARAALSSEPPVVLLAGLLGFALVVLTLRSVVEIGAPLLRGVVTILAVFTCDLWLCLARSARAWWSAGSLAGLELPLASLALVALSSGVLALLAGPALVHLPGLTPLRSRRW